MSDDGPVWFIVVFLIFYVIYDFFLGIEDDIVRPATYERAVERCDRNDGLDYLEQTGGVLLLSHKVVCNDGATFKLPKVLEK